MTDYSPSAIRATFNRVKEEMPTAVLSGILGDNAHTYGYHRGRNELPAGDYSTVLDLDRLGDGNAASALDISYGPKDMITVTNRLIKAWHDKDARLLSVVREFCGTVNGKHTYAVDLHTGTVSIDTWDSSHLWHVHLSFYRKYATNADALQGVADVIAGKPAPKPKPVPAKGVLHNAVGPARIAAGVTLKPGQSIKSANGKFHADMQADGNFVVYKGAGSKNWIWQSNTDHNAGSSLKLDAAGIHIVNKLGRTIWQFSTKEALVLVMQDDGNLVLYPHKGVALWSTRTAGR